MQVARPSHRGVKRDRVGVVLQAALIEQRGQIGAAAEPGLGRHHEARVHVHRRHMRVLQMGDQRDAGGPEPRIGFGSGNFLAEFGREFAEHGRDVDADLLEHPALHHRHHAAAAGRAGVIGAAPRRADESAGRLRGERRVRGQRFLQRFESRADVVPQRSTTPRARALRAPSRPASIRSPGVFILCPAGRHRRGISIPPPRVSHRDRWRRMRSLGGKIRAGLLPLFAEPCRAWGCREV